MVKQRLAIILSTAKSAVTAAGTATRTKEIPFRFKIAYLRIELFVGQASNLQTSIHVGALGTSADPPAYEYDRSGPNYFIGDGSILEFINLTTEYPAGHKVTAYFANQSATDNFTGSVQVVVEEV